MPAPRDLTKTLQRSLVHLEQPARRGGSFAMPIPSHFRPPGRKFVPVKDRIPYWNIAPGDRVKLVRGGEDVKGKVGTVDRVFRESNKVTLKEAEFMAKRRTPNQYPGESLKPEFNGADATIYIPRPFHVSNVRLQVMFPGGKELTALRVRRSRVTWDRRLNRFHWTRMGLVKEMATEGEGDVWFEIEWPKEEEVQHLDDVALNSPATDSLEATFIPTLSDLSLSPSPSSTSLDPTLPSPTNSSMLTLDLGGSYHSRAARTQRFNDAKRAEIEAGKGLRKEGIEGRRKRREARVEEVALA